MSKLTTFEDIFDAKDKQHDLGAYYTPDELSAQMVDRLNLESNPEANIYDPTSGFAGLIITVLDRKVALGVPKSQAILQVYGSEIDKDIMIHGLKLLETWYGDSLPQQCLEHFVCVDFLEFDPSTFWDDNGNIVRYNPEVFTFGEAQGNTTSSIKTGVDLVSDL